jgi:hypothetical protein
MSAEALLAAVVLVACLVALVRMGLGERRRQRLDAALERRGRAFVERARALWRRRRVRGQAQREADELIRRARQGGPAVTRQGNVYRPRSFGERPAGDDPGPDTDPRNDVPDGRHRKDH